jgi:uncharacterized membrane protein
MEDNPHLPPHVEETARAVERLHAEHHREATPLERLVDRGTGLFGRPAFLGTLTLLVLLWIGGNLILLWNGRAVLDSAPFPWLQGVLTLMALYMGALILMTQKRADRLAAHRAQMILHFGILSEQKEAKIIALLEELRRDSPEVRDRVDVEAKAMATPADPQVVSEVLKEIQSDEPRMQEGDGKTAT